MTSHENKELKCSSFYYLYGDLARSAKMIRRKIGIKSVFVWPKTYVVRFISFQTPGETLQRKSLRWPNTARFCWCNSARAQGFQKTNMIVLTRTDIVYFWPGTSDIPMFLLLYPLGNKEFCLFHWIGGRLWKPPQKIVNSAQIGDSMSSEPIQRTSVFLVHRNSAR